MWDVSDTLGVLTTMFTETGVVLTAVVGTIVVAVVALLGLGFAVRKTKEKITGGGTFGGPELRHTVDWDRLDRMAHGKE